MCSERQNPQKDTKPAALASLPGGCLITRASTPSTGSGQAGQPERGISAPNAGVLKSGTMTQTLRIISSMATKPLLAELVALYQTQYSQAVEVESVGGVDAAKRVQADEAFDLVILARNAMDNLAAAGKLGGVTDLVRSGVAVAVPLGAAHPDISSGDAVRQAVLDAATLGYSTGPSGVQLAKLFERWGIAEQIKTPHRAGATRSAGGGVDRPGGGSAGFSAAQRDVERAGRGPGGHVAARH